MSGSFDLLPSPGSDEHDLAAERPAGLRRTMAAADVPLLVLTNPVSIRYATGYRGYASFQSRIPSAYAFVAGDGPVVMHGAYTDDVPVVEISRRSHAVTTFDAGLDTTTAAGRFEPGPRSPLAGPWSTNYAVGGTGHPGLVSVESVKAVSEIFAPVGGEIVAVNEALGDAPETINEDPHGGGWLCKIKLADAGEVDALMSAADYQKLIDS